MRNKNSLIRDLKLNELIGDGNKYEEIKGVIDWLREGYFYRVSENLHYVFKGKNKEYILDITLDINTLVIKTIYVVSIYKAGISNSIKNDLNLDKDVNVSVDMYLKDIIYYAINIKEGGIFVENEYDIRTENEYIGR